MKSKLASCIATVLLAGQLAVAGVPAQAAGAAQARAEVQVKLPSFPVQINGVTIDSTKAAYPLLVYKDVTYFPMTWDYTQTLGLDTQWDKNNGLNLSVMYVMQKKPSPDLSATNKAASYSAKLVQYPVTINGKKIDNAAEPYPLLSFRDVTYFPMTWRFMNNEFRMKLSWSPQEGLSVIPMQHHYFKHISAEDEHFLYLSSGGGKQFKLDKSLIKLPELLTEEEEAWVQAILEKRAVQEGRLPEAVFTVPDRPLTERRGDTFYYEGKELLRLAEEGTEQRGFIVDGSFDRVYEAMVMELGEGRKIFALVDATFGKSAPNGVGLAFRYFYINGEEIHPIGGFEGWPVTGMQQNTDGSRWISSTAFPGDYINGRNVHATGELALLRPDGSSTLLNKQLNVNEIEVLSRKEDGTLIFRAYTRIPNWGGESYSAYGIYQVDTSLNLTKLSDLHGMAYVSSGGEVWVTDRELNRIDNVTTGQSKLWYDYELSFIGQ